MKTISLFLVIAAGCFAAATSAPDLERLYPMAVAFALAAVILFPARLAGVFDKASASRSIPERVVIDGSNVMYWKDNTPRIETVREVVEHLSRRGLKTGVVFDANAGYLLTDKYRHDEFFSYMLGLPEDWVMVVPKGTPADPFILKAARDMGARIVTNDRFRDWAADYPEVKTDGHLIPGGYTDAGLWFKLETEPA